MNPKGDGDDGEDGKGDVGSGGSEGETAVKGTLLAALFLVAVVGGFGSVGYIYKDQINGFLTQFSGFIEGNFEIILQCPYDVSENFLGKIFASVCDIIAMPI